MPTGGGKFGQGCGMKTFDFTSPESTVQNQIGESLWVSNNLTLGGAATVIDSVTQFWCEKVSCPATQLPDGQPPVFPPNVAPEPTTLSLLVLGLAGVGFAARRRSTTGRQVVL